MDEVFNTRLKSKNYIFSLLTRVKIKVLKIIYLG